MTFGETPNIIGAAPVAVVPGREQFGPLTIDEGEIGLYNGNGFSDPDAILSYVEWGETGHGRSAVAVSAGIWQEGDFVEVPEGSSAISAPNGAEAADGWVVQ